MEPDVLVSAAITLSAAAMAVTRLNAVHALLYLIVALLALALIFARLGAPFAAVIQVIIYAGAITVLFVFVVMMLNLGAAAEACERQWMPLRQWRGPTVLALVLFVESVYVIVHGAASDTPAAVGAKAVGATLFGPWIVVVELTSLMLLAGLVVVWHVGQGGIGEQR